MRYYRYRAGLSQAALAARAGLSEAAISALERGTRNRPYPHTLDLLASALSLTPDERAALAEPAPVSGGRAADAGPAHAAQPGDSIAAPAPSPAPGSLPTPLTSFVGRERELAGAAGLVAAGFRLLTLTGPGGTGKTRLATECARAVAHNFPAGVWFVDLAPLPPHGEIAGTVAAVLGVRDVPGRDLQAGILAALSGGQTLLLLDNCEHVLDACAALVTRLLQEAPGLTLLATSREPLRLAGEQIYTVPPLGLPPDDGSFEALDAEAPTQFAAIRLFVDRARMVLPSFALTPEQTPAVTELCRRLDGLPLAIELAAARIRTLTPAELADRLTDRFRLVAGNARDRLPRHQTLRALIDWSHDLLTPEEQALLRRLAVFAGGWDLAAAEAVGAGAEVDDGDVLDRLEALIDKSLVVAETREGTARYELLESIREYAAEKLEASGEAAGVHDLHAAYLLQLARSARRGMMGPAQAEWIQRLEREHHNLRAALAWTVGQGDAETAVRLCAALSMFWYIRGHYREGRHWTARALAGVPPASPRARAAALQGAASLADIQHDFGESLPLVKESVVLWREVGDHRGLATALAALAMHARHKGDLPAARQASEEALAIYATTPDPWGERLALGVLGWVAEAEGDHAEAERLMERSLAAAQAARSPTDIALQLNNLGILALRRGDAQAAMARYREALRCGRDVDAREPIACSLEGLGGVAAARQQYQRAARLIGAAEAVRTVIGAPRISQFEEEHDRVLPAVQTALGERAFAAAQAEGQALTPAEAIAYALEEPAVISTLRP